ncbi:MAG: HAD family hydrolase [Victivallales bacterium]|nr:HAD family hydrolase [Victivallales bacterium]
MPPANVLVLDFDGVLCASAQETAVSAWRAGQRFFPEWSGPEPSDEAIAAFTAVRPILETGYQSILLMKRIVDGVPVDEIRAFGSAAAEELVATLGLERTELIAAFGGARDAWIEADLPDWLSRHDFFPGTLERVRERLADDTPVFIATTKQERFVEALLAGQGIELPTERIFGLDARKKKEQVLRELSAQFPESRLHFVEDRIDTLRRVQACPELAGVQLYYADWGYGLPADLVAAHADPRLHVWSLDQFLALV